jgi:hypothetical protein
MVDVSEEKKMKRLLGILGLLVVILLSYFTVSTLFRAGYFPMHDDTQVTRVYEMSVAIKDGQLPVRWVKDLGYGYGYPIFNFYAPLAYYVGSFISLVGPDPLTATKYMIILGLVMAGLTMYFFARSFWGVTGGIVAAAFYLYAPYHAVNVYVRGAIAETWAYAFVPLTFYGLWKVYAERKWRYVIFGSLGFAGVILSHNLTAMMILPFYIFLVIVLSALIIKAGERKSWLLLPTMAIISMMLSAFYWMPAIQEMGYTNVRSQITGTGSVYGDHFVCPMQLWDSPWGFGGSTKGCIDGMSFKLGKIAIIASVVSLALGVFFIRNNNKNRNAVILTFLGLLLVIFLMTPYSKSIWDAISPMAYFQFPWRFLLLGSFFTSFLAGAIPYIVEQINVTVKAYKYAAIGMAVGLVGIVIFMNAKYFMPLTINDKTSDDYTKRSVIVWKVSKISDEYMPKGFAKPKSEKDIVKSKITSIDSLPAIDITKDTTTNLEATVISNVPTRLLLNIAYFPAWQVFLDGKAVDYKIEDNGLLIQVPEGEHVVSARFIPTEIETTANLISLAGVIVLFLGIIAAWMTKSL